MLLIPEATRGVSPLPFSIVVAHTATHHAAASKLPTEPYTQGRRLLALCKKSARALGVAVVCCDLDYPVRLPWRPAPSVEVPSGFVYVDMCYLVPDAPVALSAAMLKAIWMWSLGRGAKTIVVRCTPSQQSWYEHLGMSLLEHNEDALLLTVLVHQIGDALLKSNPELYSFFYNEQHPDIRLVRGCAPSTG